MGTKLKQPAKKRKSIGAVQTSKKIDLQKSNSSDSITSTDSNEIIQKTIKNEVKKPAKKRKISSSFIEPREIPRLGAKTLDLGDVGTDGSSQSGDEQRPRRQLNNNLLFDSAALSTRVLFPVEVKACAIQRIRDGETKVQVARDLQCPISTVASWWHRRASIVPELASEVNSDSAVSSATESEPIEAPERKKNRSQKKKKKKKKKS